MRARPRPREIQLQYWNHRFCCTLTPEEAKRMLKQKEAIRVNAHTLRMPEPVKPSESRDSPPMLTLSDTKALVGLIKMDEPRKERLIGFGLLPEPQDEKPGIRVLRIPMPPEPEAVAE